MNERDEIVFLALLNIIPDDLLKTLISVLCLNASHDLLIGNLDEFHQNV
jgi:hypothetical protein